MIVRNSEKYYANDQKSMTSPIDVVSSPSSTQLGPPLGRLT